MPARTRIDFTIRATTLKIYENGAACAEGILMVEILRHLEAWVPLGS